MSNNTTMTNPPAGCGCAACSEIAQHIGATPDLGVGGVEGNASALFKGTRWSSDGDVTPLTYRFFDDSPDYYSVFDTESYNFKAFNNQMQDATIRVLDQLETFTNITFTESQGTDRQTQIGFGQTSLPANTGAWAYYPTSHPKGGDVWTNADIGSTTTPQEGNYGFFVLLHEIGHALGLQHSFEELFGKEATSQYSVMAYDWPYFPESYMLYDIAALQALYGANTTHNTGDDVYTLKSDQAYTVWDAGGNDTFSAANQSRDVVIDLKEGAFSSVGLANNIAIAYNTVIENAEGGAGDDIIYGNDADNILNGNAGNDTFFASAGSDTIDGGAGEDTVRYAQDLSSLVVEIISEASIQVWETSVAAVKDTLNNIEKFFFNNVQFNFTQLEDFAETGVSKNYIEGNDKKNKITGTDGDDVINGYGGKDKLFGGAGNDIIHGGSGKNKLFGDAGDDVITAGSGKDKIYGGSGNDEIDAGGGKNKIYGDDGNDTITAGSGKDKIFGGAGDDIINAGGGKNKIYGDDGNDIFVFDALSGSKNKIVDFDVSEDRIDLSDVLQNYSSLDHDIADFVEISTKSKKAYISVNESGSGDDFTTLARIDGLKGADINDLEDLGVIII